jgi:hypothetical protein
MTTYFGAIADDFTGATDLAGLLARSNVPVSLRVGVPKTPPVKTAPLEIIALKCRTAPVRQAVDEASRGLPSTGFVEPVPRSFSGNTARHLIRHRAATSGQSRKR